MPKQFKLGGYKAITISTIVDNAHRPAGTTLAIKP